jgi:hypothetical protein
LWLFAPISGSKLRGMGCQSRLRAREVHRWDWGWEGRRGLG